MTQIITASKRSFALWLCLCGFFGGCGKKVEQKTAGERDVRSPALSTSVVTLSNDGKNPGVYSMPAVSKVYIPPRLKYIGGDKNSPAVILFNGGTSYEAKCVYDYELADRYALVECLDGDDPLSRQTQTLIHMIGDQIKLKNSSVKVEAELEIDWH